MSLSVFVVNLTKGAKILLKILLKINSQQHHPKLMVSKLSHAQEEKDNMIRNKHSKHICYGKVRKEHPRVREAPGEEYTMLS